MEPEISSSSSVKEKEAVMVVFVAYPIHTKIEGCFPSVGLVLFHFWIELVCEIGNHCPRAVL